MNNLQLIIVTKYLVNNFSSRNVKNKAAHDQHVLFAFPLFRVCLYMCVCAHMFICLYVCMHKCTCHIIHGSQESALHVGMSS